MPFILKAPQRGTLWLEKHRLCLSGQAGNLLIQPPTHSQSFGLNMGLKVRFGFSVFFFSSVLRQVNRSVVLQNLHSLGFLCELESGLSPVKL